MRGLTIPLTIAAAFAACCAMIGQAQACEVATARQATFTADRDMHKLCVMGKNGDPEFDALAEKVAGWVKEYYPDLNVLFEKVDMLDPDLEWQDYGFRGAPPEDAVTLPMVVLVGHNTYNRRFFVIDHWEGGMTKEDFDLVVASDVRGKLADNVGKYWAVLLYSPKPGGGSADVRQAIEGTMKQWEEEHPPGVVLVEFDREDPEERLLNRFIFGEPPPPEFADEVPQEEWIGAVFGRGKLMSPPLVGDDISQESINSMLLNTRVPCTCLTTPNSLGVDLPVVWTKDMDAMVVSLDDLVDDLDPESIQQAVDRIEGELAATVPAEEQSIASTAGVTIGIAVGAAVLLTIAMVWLAARRGKANIEE